MPLFLKKLQIQNLIQSPEEKKTFSVNVFANVLFKYNLMSFAGDVLGPYFNVSSEIDTGSSTRETFNF